MTVPPLVPLLDRKMLSAVSDFHTNQGHFAPEQGVAWQTPTGNRISGWVVNLADRQAVAASRLEAHYSRRQLSCVVRVQRGPVAESIPAFLTHVSRLRDLLGEMADELIIQPQVPGATVQDLVEAVVPLGFEQVATIDSPSATLLVDLRPALEDILASFRPSVQRQIRSIARRGLVCRRVVDADDLAELVRCYNRFARKRGLGPVALDATIAMSKAPSSACALPFMLPISARVESTLVGGALFFLCGSRLVYQWGFTERTAGDSLPITHACFWHAIQTVHRQGIKELDLGGYWLDRGSHDSINRFKLGFSSTIESHGPKLRYSYARRLRWRALLPSSVPHWP